MKGKMKTHKLSQHDNLVCKCNITLGKGKKGKLSTMLVPSTVHNLGIRKKGDDSFTDLY